MGSFSVVFVVTPTFILNVSMQEKHYPDHNILELYNVLLQLQLATSKMKINLVSELPDELPNEKRQIWMKTEPSVQSPSQKLNFNNSSQKLRKSRCQSFAVLSNFYRISLLCSKYVVQCCSTSRFSQNTDTRPKSDMAQSTESVTWRRSMKLIVFLTITKLGVSIRRHPYMVFSNTVFY